MIIFWRKWHPSEHVQATKCRQSFSPIRNNMRTVGTLPKPHHPQLHLTNHNWATNWWTGSFRAIWESGQKWLLATALWAMLCRHDQVMWWQFCLMAFQVSQVPLKLWFLYCHWEYCKEYRLLSWWVLFVMCSHLVDRKPDSLDFIGCGRVSSKTEHHCNWHGLNVFVANPYLSTA